MKKTRIFFMIAAILLINISVYADDDKIDRYVVMNVKKPVRFIGENSDTKSIEILIKVDTISGNVWQWMEGIDIKNRMHTGKWDLMQDFTIPVNFQDDKRN
jgi:hypothetical protein